MTNLPTTTLRSVGAASVALTLWGVGSSTAWAAVAVEPYGPGDAVFVLVGAVLALLPAVLLALILPLRRSTQLPVGLACWAMLTLGASVFLKAGNGGCGGSPVDTSRLMMGKVAQQIEIYGLRKGYPAVDDLYVVFPEGLPRDAWDHPFGYVTPGPNGRPFDLISLDADGQFGGSGNNADLRYSSL